jgi:putative ABC transport system permease protein
MHLYNLKIAIRNASSNSTLTFAKLFGLCISFTVVLFSVGYVYFETSFDKHVPGHDLIYRCLMQGRLNNQDADFAVTSPEQAKAIVSEIPEITEAVRIFARGEAAVNFDNEYIHGGYLFYTDPDFFSFFSIPILVSIDQPLASESNLMITESLARKLFGSIEEAIGKEIKLRGDDCVITGVFSDVPKNFHLQAHLVQSLQKTNPDVIGWDSQSYYTYFKTDRPDISLHELNFKISKTVYTHYDDTMDGANATTIEDLKHSPAMYLLFTAERLTDIHFSNHKFDPAVTSNKMYVYGAIVLAFLVLLISSVNFINLTIANISTRLKEVGIRKTTGAGNSQIISYFLFESLLFWLAGFVLALLIYHLAGNSLVEYLGLEIAITNNEFLKIIILSFTGLLVFNLAINFFPIILFSKKKVLSLIKGEKSLNKSFSINNGFVLFQFILSGLIIMCSLIVQKQINFMVNKDRGYDSENVIMFHLHDMNSETRKSFIEELKSYSAIKSVSTSGAYFGTDPSMNSAFFETYEDENYFHTTVLPVDHEFPNTFNLEIIEGRFFEKEMQTDFNAAIINETAFKTYSGNGSIIGKNLICDGDYKIIGIVRDFNFRSLHHPVQPLVILRTENAGNIFIKVSNNQVSEVIEILKDKWGKFEVSSPLDYTFHDELVAGHYNRDQQAKRLLLVLSVISVAIACVGLYAISFFSIIKRTKEIGIRKVNGARIWDVMALLNINFIKWVILAYIIAIPVAWFTMNNWLDNFAYMTELSWEIFSLAGLLLIGIAFLTVSWQSWRAAKRNPVEALRYE